MRKTIFVFAILLVFVLCACNAIPGTDSYENIDEQQFKTVKTSDDRLSISVPESWTKDYTFTEEEMKQDGVILTMTDNNITYVTVYFFDNVDYDYPLNAVLTDNLSHFADSVIGGYEEMKLNGMDVFIIKYSMVDVGIDGYEYNYYGYDYMINTPYGVVDIDIYYVQEVIGSKIFKPSQAQLLFLQEVAESLRAN